MKETEFAVGAPNDPYGFRPTDLIVDRDGSLLVSDWADGQRPKRGRGRIYRIQYEGEARPLARGLDSPSYLARVEAQTELERLGRAGLRDLEFEKLGMLGRLHAVWLIAQAGDRERLFEIAQHDPDVSVRVQAVRALADLFDPILVAHKLDSGGGDPEAARRLSSLCRDQNPQMLLEVTVALGRLRWNEAPDWLRANLGTPDAALAHAAQQTLRRSGNWPAVLEWLDARDDSPWRLIAQRALADQAFIPALEGVIRRLERSPSLNGAAIMSNS